MTDKQSYEDQIFEALCDCVGPNPDDIYDRTIAIGKQADTAIAELEKQLAEKEARIAELESGHIMNLKNILRYLEKTDDKKWCRDVVRTKNGLSNCLFGHLFDYGGNYVWNLFEELYSTTYAIYPVNDGENPKYQQVTPKQRCIAYLENIRDGKEETTQESMERCYQEHQI